MDIPLRIVFIGNVDSGKSTLIGVLSTNKLDDGKGNARKSVFNHSHEQDSGRTSSISMKFCEINNKQSILIDLCGHEKYLKTTLFGLNLIKPDYCILMVGGNMGLSHMTKEHLLAAVTLGLKVIICVTKIDIAPTHVLKRTINDIQYLCKRINKKIFLINGNESSNLTDNDIMSVFIPVFKISNVTGKNIDRLTNFISNLNKINDYPVDEQPEFIVDNSYNVKGVGIVLSGTINKGIISVGDSLFIKRHKSNEFVNITIKSIYDFWGKSVKTLTAGNHCTIHIKENNKKKTITKNNIKKGLVIVNKDNCTTFKEFIADIFIFHHSTTVCKKTKRKAGYQPIIHCNGVRQSAEIVNIFNDKGFVRANDKCRAHFRFVHYNEHLKTGSKFLFREGNTRGIGKIVQLIE